MLLSYIAFFYLTLSILFYFPPLYLVPIRESYLVITNLLKKGGPIQTSFFSFFFNSSLGGDKFDTNLNLPCGNLFILILKIINVKALFIHIWM